MPLIWRVGSGAPDRIELGSSYWAATTGLPAARPARNVRRTKRLLRRIMEALAILTADPGDEFSSAEISSEATVELRAVR